MNKKELRTISRDFRNYASRLLTTKSQTGLDDARRLISVIDSTPILKKYVEECVELYKVDIKQIREQLGYHDKYKLPLMANDEVAFTYQLLTYGIDNFGEYWAFAKGGYSSGSRSIQDHIDNFNEEVVKHFINHIKNFLEDIIINEEFEENSIKEESKHFISYCWADIDVVDMIDTDLKELYGITLTRDQRDLQFKDSIKVFMQSLNDHDNVIIVISDNYLKSNNCMYEVMEVMRDRRYRDKIFCVILSDSDGKYYDETSLQNLSLNGKKVGCDIYDIKGRIGYSCYWTDEYKKVSSAIEGLDEFTRMTYVAELKQLRNITENIGEFLGIISDMKNESLEELKKSKYESFAKAMKLEFVTVNS